MARKGKTDFTAQEIRELKNLIRQRVCADRADQKTIRNKMRRLGFYGSDFGIIDCHVSDLDRLINNGKIKVVGQISAPGDKVEITIPRKKKEVNPVVPKQFVIPSKAEDSLIHGQFLSVSSFSREDIPDVPGLYCIKLRKGIASLPSKYGKVREDGIIYIGKASVSLRKRLWDQELNHKSAATFFRSIGAMLGYLPPRGSLSGKETRNYKFNDQDTEAIRGWMRQSLFVSYIPFAPDQQKRVEETLIVKYCPLVNIEHNPSASEELKTARQRCVDYAKK